MATNPTVPNDRLRLHISVENNQAIVRINGQDYRFTVEKRNGMGWTNVTGIRDWTELAQHVTELFTQFYPENIEEGQIVLNGDFSNVESSTHQLQPRQVTFESAEVSVKNQNGQKETKRVTQDDLPRLDQSVKQIVQQKIAQFRQDIAAARPITNPTQQQPLPQQTSNPVSQQPAIPPLPQPEFEEVVTVKICENRPHSAAQNSANHNRTTADFILADQLLKEHQVHKDFVGKSTEQVAQILRAKVAKHISNNTPVFFKTKNALDYSQGELFNDILSSLRKARDLDSTRLSAASKKYKMDDNKLRSLLSKEINTLEKKDRQALVAIYTNYLQDETPSDVRCLGQIFFKAFVEAYKKDCLQIVIIEDLPAPSRSQKATPILPPGETVIDPPRCAFLHLNSTGQFTSYHRGADQQLGLIDLNTSTNLATLEKREQKRKLPPITPATVLVEDIDDSGRCLDFSLAYLMLKKAGKNDLMKAQSNHQQVIDLANQLRNDVAQKMLGTAELDQDLEFIHYLAVSIDSIPETQLNDRMKKILKEQHYADTSTPEMRMRANNARKEMREFYARYITQVDQSNKMTNHLGAAFLYVLPKIDVPQSVASTFTEGLCFAVVQGDRIIAKYPMNAELKEDWPFINYNGVNHYTAVNMSYAANRIKEMITANKQEIFKEFLSAMQNGHAPTQIKQRLLSLRDQLPQTYDLLVQYMTQKNNNTNLNIDAADAQLLATLLIRVLTEESNALNNLNATLSQ
jgi:hypothetical protein